MRRITHSIPNTFRSDTTHTSPSNYKLSPSIPSRCCILPLPWSSSSLSISAIQFSNSVSRDSMRLMRASVSRWSSQVKHEILKMRSQNSMSFIGDWGDLGSTVVLPVGCNEAGVALRQALTSSNLTTESLTTLDTKNPWANVDVLFDLCIDHIECWLAVQQSGFDEFPTVESFGYLYARLDVDNCA
ncbi:hypothetical protein J1614_007832 [Plenodomus biglobosus]|nr:hypothetical protein J1614_007832 [Plenodomus biglobosus]